MLKKLSLPFIWWLRIMFKVAMEIALSIGGWIAAIHGVLFILELNFKGYTLVIDQDSMVALAVNKKTGEGTYVNIAKGAIYEVKVSKANAESIIQDSTDDGVQDERTDDNG